MVLAGVIVLSSFCLNWSSDQPLFFSNRNEVVFLQDFHFADHLEARRSDFSDKYLLASPDMPHDKIAAFALNPMEVDQDYSASGSKGIMDGLQGALWKLEVVVGVADEHEIDGVLGQLGRELIALDRLDVLDLAISDVFSM